MTKIHPNNWIAAARMLRSTKPETEFPLKDDHEPITGIDVALDLHNRFDTTAMGHDVFENTVNALLNGKLVLVDSKNQFAGYCPMTFNNIQL